MSLTELHNQLDCPVCFEVYETIVQCKKGHSVCKKCSESLKICPTCRDTYIGTRNYTLEEVVRNLKQLKNFQIGAPTTPAPKLSNSAAPVASTSHAPGPVPSTSHASGPVPSASNAPSLNALPAQSNTLLLTCRATDCKARMPIAQLYSHLRVFHENNFNEVNFNFTDYDSAFTEDYDFPITRNTYEYINIRRSGLFVLIFRVGQIVDGKRPVYCWVQRSYSDEKAREFSYALTMRISNRWSVEFDDYVHGEESTETDIMRETTCLHVAAPLYVKSAEIELEIYRTEGSRNYERNNETEWIKPDKYDDGNNYNNNNKNFYFYFNC